mgnify:CR=1 FL=1
MSRKTKAVVHPRPFLLFYGESRKQRVDESNYHLRSRCSTITGAMRAAISRLHQRGDAQRVDIYDIANMYYGYVRCTEHGYEVHLLAYAWQMHNEELKRNDGVVDRF